MNRKKFTSYDKKAGMIFSIVLLLIAIPFLISEIHHKQKIENLKFDDLIVSLQKIDSYKCGYVKGGAHILMRTESEGHPTRFSIYGIPKCSIETGSAIGQVAKIFELEDKSRPMSKDRIHEDVWQLIIGDKTVINFSEKVDYRLSASHEAIWVIGFYALASACLLIFFATLKIQE